MLLLKLLGLGRESGTWYIAGHEAAPALAPCCRTPKG